MGKNAFRRHLDAAAVVSLAVLVASCGGGRQDAAPVIMNGAGMNATGMNAAGMNALGANRIEAAPMPPPARTAMAPPLSPHGSPSRPPPSGPGVRIVVRTGMSVRYLAHLYGVTRQAIIDANHLEPPLYKIEIGQTLVVPGATGERAPVRAASAEQLPEPAPERPAARRPAKAGEVIPLDEPAPAPKKTAEAAAAGLSPPAAPPRAKLSPPAAETERPQAEPVEEHAASAEPSAKAGGHYPWPVRGRILAGYGATKEGGRNAGINIAAARGAPVRAVDSGTVAYAGNEIRGYGNLVLVKHPDGFISAYAHLDSLLVKRGDTVRSGQIIAKVGNTGGVSEPQLHFELRRGKNAVDPREFLGPGAKVGGAKDAEG
jgi:murein DD-endopeptidase MepM/ murein hydrolase activator NlpD